MSDQTVPLAVRVLLVEDSRADGELIEALLADGKWPESVEFEVSRVSRLYSAKDLLNHESPDLVLLDLNLPDSGSENTLQEINRVFKGLPVVVMTGVDDNGLAAEAIRNGAQDYLVKDDVNSDNLARSARYALERFRRQQLEFELAGASIIQKRLLPSVLPKVEGFDIAARCIPAESVGGDYYDVIRLADGAAAVIVGDVAGHGLGPALLMAETRGILRGLAQSEVDPGTILQKSNRIIAKDCAKGAFITLFVARLGIDGMSIRFACAGHDGQVLFPDGTLKRRLISPAPPIGVIGDYDYETESEIDLALGETLMCCTDGITESYCAEKDTYFGMPRLIDAISLQSTNTSQQMLEALFKAAIGFQTDQHDDMTAVIVRAVGCQQ